MTIKKVYGSDVYNKVIELLEKRGVSIKDIAEIVLFLQSEYISNLDVETCIESVEAVFQKREVQNVFLTGIQLDILAEEGKLLFPLQEMLASDEPLYGVDEVMALGIVNIYGSIGFTNYGYVDKLKHGVLKKLNDKRNGVHTFLDDLVGAVAAAASSRIAHRHRREEEEKWRQEI
ncbi:phosphatidylglycerophosphatase A family protein [Brevibacillus ginsengisoli]|uniref:phosphatidylglycerophosphatase A family protein n=1 Tax=Brevibacillus ginsengisoli TaxID=363854 RepID=UPI003CF4C85E